MSASGNWAVYSKGHWSLCPLSVCCCVILGLMSWTDRLLSESEQRPLARRCRFVSVCSIISHHSHSVCVWGRGREKERGIRKTVAVFPPCRGAAQTVTIWWPVTDPFLVFLSHTHRHIHTLRAGLRPSDEWVTTRLLPHPLRSVGLCQTS